MESEKGEEVELQSVGSGGETQEMELENIELKELKRIRDELREEIDLLEKEAEEDRKRIKLLGAPLPQRKWGTLLLSDWSRPEYTSLFHRLDLVEVAASLHACAASQAASAAAIAARAASVAKDFAQAAPHVHTATGPQADAIQATAFVVATEIVRLTTSAASKAAAAKRITKSAAFVQDNLASALAAALAEALEAPAATAAAPQAPVEVEEEQVLNLKL